MSKKSKFDLTTLVNQGYVKANETFYYVTDPSKKCQVKKMLNNEYKVTGMDGKPCTIHAFVQFCLGTEAPDHATKWLKTTDGKILFEIWTAAKEESKAA